MQKKLGKRKKALCLWAREATGQRPSQRASPAGPARGARARPPVSNLTSGPRGERKAREREERMTGGARLSSLTRGQGGRGAHRRRCRPRRGQASARLAWRVADV